MKTVTIQIGNSDDKLSQKEWCEFLAAVASVIDREKSELHFSGFSNPAAPWQNAAFVAVLTEGARFRLARKLKEIRRRFRQESIAWTEGETEFV